MIARMDTKTILKILGIIIVFGLIVLFDLRSLLKVSPRTKTMVTYFLIIGINLTVSILLISGLELMSPAMIFEKLVRLFIPGKPVQ